MFIWGSLENRVVDFLLVFIELFFARCYGLGDGRKEIENRQFRSNAVSFIKKFEVEGVAPPIIFARMLGQWMPYNFTTLSLTVFTQRNFVADFLQAKCDFRRKTAVLRFWASLWGT